MGFPSQLKKSFTNADYRKPQRLDSHRIGISLIDDTRAISRHCERSAAIHGPWIAALRSQ
jgi:hypothetical protein